MAKTKRKAAPAQKEDTKPADEKLDTLIGRVYLIKKTGVELLDGVDAQPTIKQIQEGTKDNTDRDMAYTFYEDGKPVYVAVENGNLSPVTFPEPGEENEKTPTGEKKMGMSSMRLYSLAVTLAQTIEKIIELETTPKPSLIDQAKKIMTPTIAIIACVFVIFLIVISMQ